MSDLGFAEAFMYGDVECDDLVTLFKVSLHSLLLRRYSPLFLVDIPIESRKSGRDAVTRCKFAVHASSTPDEHSIPEYAEQFKE